VTAIRIAIGVIIGAIVAVALVPLGVLLDLAGGGDGFGLCEGGLSECRTSFFDGPELLGLLAAIMFLLVMALRAAIQVRSMIERRRDEEALDPSARRFGN
jgi:hypothetical protein